MNRAINQFRANIVSVRNLDSLYSKVKKDLPLVDSSDILRVEIVLIISALDSFIHDLVRLGMVETFKGNRPASPAFEKFELPLKTLQEMLAPAALANRDALLDIYIRERNSSDSFQSPKGIEYALQLIDVKGIWSKLSPLMGVPPNEIKDKLGFIVDRRNKIAHESDVNPGTSAKYPIDQPEVQDIVKFIDDLCEAIFKVV